MIHKCTNLFILKNTCTYIDFRFEKKTVFEYEQAKLWFVTPRFILYDKEEMVSECRLL